MSGVQVCGLIVLLAAALLFIAAFALAVLEDRSRRRRGLK